MEKILSTFVIPTVEEYIDEPLIIEKSDGIHRRNECIFCRIAHGEDPNTELLYKVSLLNYFVNFSFGHLYFKLKSTY